MDDFLPQAETSPRKQRNKIRKADSPNKPELPPVTSAQAIHKTQRHSTFHTIHIFVPCIL